MRCSTYKHIIRNVQYKQNAVLKSTTTAAADYGLIWDSNIEELILILFDYWCYEKECYKIKIIKMIKIIIED